MDRNTKSINLNRSFTRLTLDEKRELRGMHEDLRNRFIAALADLQSVRSNAGCAHSHADPMEALRDLQDVIKFSEIPNEFKRRENKAVAVAGVESIVKHCMQNENYRSPSQMTTSQQGHDHHGSHIVDPSRPLPLSFEARREQIMKSHTKRVESGLSGLFSKNAEIVHGVPQGPIPNLYTPSSNSRRFEIEAERKAAVDKMVGNTPEKRSPRLDGPRVHLHGVKVPKDFLPTCCVPHGPFQDPEIRSQIEKKKAERHAKFISSAPFK
mmetsp:Transcript_20095/g.23152  ORF Transcript_20095/g.23152 Transcript_20095/m.23152 type:complete len:267 (-) Transcript_20095:356-1156(-)|eukprot:CAMPEP_0176450424 /NCGR_PEP_ID=MMETSP0127-20121128/27140_1 /TAXON_ID=938130 /ORGANISM="Platyophrya macrostoma, Strain WH" /LENGTH=266 /DNA_ID=CAMNT_0017838101 /DNA_START=50 /DNA_END=850 /DNA_ORIENTATION=-